MDKTDSVEGMFSLIAASNEGADPFEEWIGLPELAAIKQYLPHPHFSYLSMGKVVI